MAFYGRNFIFGGVPSENYNLTISSVESDSSTPGPDVELMTTKIYRRPKVYLYGVSQKPVIQFPIVFNTPYELTSEDFSLAAAWLLGKQTFTKLEIIQEDMVGIFFNCFLTAPEIQKTGNIITGLKVLAVCDSPFAWTYPIVTNYPFGSPPSSYALTFDNYSHDSYYLFPKIEFQMAGAGDLSITNTSDASRLFNFTGLSSGEIITVDNDLEIVTSSLSIARLPKFNLNFLRFAPGRNNLLVTGNISYLKLTYSFTKKIGG